MSKVSRYVRKISFIKEKEKEKYFTVAGEQDDD